MSKVIHSFYGHNRNALEFKHSREDFILFYQNCYFCLSSIYANQSGFDIDLYTNYDFGQLLDNAPYKHIYNVFEDHEEYAKIDPKIWAWPKFVALDMASRDSVHIDGDVFLKDKSCKKLLEYNGYDVIVQHAETYEQSVYFKDMWADTPGGILASMGHCFINNTRFYVTPWINRKTGEFVTAGTYTAPEKYQYLYKHLLDNGDIISVPYFNQKLLFRTPRDIVRMISANDESWKEYVPEAAYRMAEHLKTEEK